MRDGAGVGVRRRCTLRGAAVAAVMVLLFLRAPTPRAEDGSLLSLGQPLSVDLRDQEVHWHHVHLTAGVFVEGRVIQRGIDVVVTIDGPDSRRLVDIDSPSGEEGTEYVSLVTNVAGDYRIGVRPYEKAATGGYTISFSTARPATGSDRRRVELEWAAHGAYMRSQDVGTVDSFKQAFEGYRRTLALWQASGNTELTAATLGSMGVLSEFMGEPGAALEAHTRALTLWRQLRASERQVNELHNIGNLDLVLGDLPGALRANVEALKLARLLADSGWEAHILTGLGQTYDALDQQENALRYYQQAVALSRKLQDRIGEAHALTAMGDLNVARGRTDEAHRLLDDSLALRRSSRNKKGEARSLRSLGNAYFAAGERSRALEHYNRALTLQRSIGDRVGEAHSLHAIGVAQACMGDASAGARTLGESVALARKLGVRRLEAEALYQTARIRRATGQLAEARGRLDEAIAIVEAPHARSLGDFFRAAYVGSTGDYYALAVDLLVDEHLRQPGAGLDAKAYQASERFRARALVDWLGAASRPRGLDPLLGARLRELQNQIDAKAHFQIRFQGRKHSAEDLVGIERQLQDLLTEYRQVQNELVARHPRYKDLLSSDPTTVAAIQAQLHPSEVLLEYMLGDERSYLWTITASSFSLSVLPPRQAIESAVRPIYVQLSTRPAPESGATAVGSFDALAGPVASMLLGPALPAIRQGKTLIIVPDGILNYLPFATLPSPLASGASSGASYHPLVIDRAVVSLPSASLMLALRRDASRRAAPARNALVIADPVLDEADPRVPHRSKLVSYGKAPNSTRGPAEASSEWSPGFATTRLECQPTRAPTADLAGGGGELEKLPRLLYSRREARAITQLLGGFRSKLALDFEANHELVTRSELSRYRIIHFATHAYVNSSSPELSGVILSRIDEKGQLRDGVLRLHEIYDMRLSADLVVLSACQTALGTAIRGEGLLGLARGFIHAGAARVIASLWKVDDRVSYEIMRHFYEALREPHTASSALQSAQLQVLRSETWNHPYFWGAFVLQGEPL